MKILEMILACLLMVKRRKTADDADVLPFIFISWRDLIIHLPGMEWMVVDGVYAWLCLCTFLVEFVQLIFIIINTRKILDQTVFFSSSNLIYTRLIGNCSKFQFIPLPVSFRSVLFFASFWTDKKPSHFIGRENRI